MHYLLYALRDPYSSSLRLRHSMFGRVDAVAQLKACRSVEPIRMLLPGKPESRLILTRKFQVYTCKVSGPAVNLFLVISKRHQRSLCSADCDSAVMRGSGANRCVSDSRPMLPSVSTAGVQRMWFLLCYNETELSIFPKIVFEKGEVDRSFLPSLKKGHSILAYNRLGTIHL